MTKTRVNNNAPTHKYFTTMLNMADDDLDPFQYRLLAHYIRKSGHGGSIDESVRETASLTKMSTVKVQKARNQLEAAGYIDVKRPSKIRARKGDTVVVTILDRWAENINRYNNKAVSDLTQVETEGVLNITQQPVLEITQPTREAVLNITRKDKYNNKEPKKKNSEEHEFRIEWEQYSDYGCALLKAFNIDCAFQSPSEMPRSALLNYLDTAKELKPAGATLEEIPALHRYVAQRAKRENWNGFSVKTLARYFLDYRATTRKIIQVDPSHDLNTKLDFEPPLTAYLKAASNE